MLILKCTTYDNRSVVINMRNVIFFHENGKGGTVFVYGVKVGDDVLLNQHVTQTPDQVGEMLTGDKFFQCTSFEDIKIFVNIGNVAFFRENDKDGTAFVFPMLLAPKLMMNQHVKESLDDVYFMITESVNPEITKH